MEWDAEFRRGEVFSYLLNVYGSYNWYRRLCRPSQYLNFSFFIFRFYLFICKNHTPSASCHPSPETFLQKGRGELRGCVLVLIRENPCYPWLKRGYPQGDTPTFNLHCDTSSEATKAKGEAIP